MNINQSKVEAEYDKYLSTTRPRINNFKPLNDKVRVIKEDIFKSTNTRKYESKRYY